METPTTPLKEAILRSDLTQSALAARLGIDKGQMSRYANGLAVPEPRRIAIAAVLGVSPRELWPDLAGSGS